jgi:cell division protein ZipA
MDKDLLRIILAASGVFLLLGIYLWDRLRKRRKKQAGDDYPEMDTESDADLLSLNPAEERAAEVNVDLAISPFEDDVAPSDQHEEKSAKQQDVREGAEVVNVREKGGKTAVASAAMPPLIQFGVVAPPGSVFNGDQLIEALTEVGLEYGEMEIFHRYDKASDTRLFSVASMVEPGTFPIDDIALFQCPGLLLFFQPLGVPDPVAAFDEMVETCHELGRRLGGDEWDSKRKQLTEETIEALRRSLMSG